MVQQPTPVAILMQIINITCIYQCVKGIIGSSPLKPRSILWTLFVTAPVLSQLWKLPSFMEYMYYYFFSSQQSHGSVQAHGTGVYEDLPCGLVSDRKIYTCS